MNRRLYMLLGEKNLAACLTNSPPVIFANNAEGHAAFLRWLPASVSETNLLIDLPTEEFRRERAPHLAGRRHLAMLQRKLDLLFRDLTFRLAARQSRETDNRRDDILLFSALQNPEPLQSWLAVLQGAAVPLRGIYSLAQLGGHLLRKTSVSHVLLVSWQANIGLRQSYFINAQLAFSRLTSCDSADGFIDSVCNDIPDTCRYLASSGLLPDSTTLEVRIIGKKSELQQLRKRLPETPGRQHRFVMLESLLRGLNVAAAPNNSDATRVWLALLARHPPVQSYALPMHTHAYRLRRTRKQIFGASIATVAIAFLCAGFFYWQAGQKNETTQALQPLISGMQREVTAIETTQSESKVPAAEMRASVEWFRRIEQQSLNPRDFLLPMSQAFERHPDIMLDELSWQTITGVPPVVRIRIECYFSNHENDPRAALAEIDRFRTDLTGEHQTVQILRLPAGGNPDDSLESREDTIPTDHRFALEVTWQTPG